MVQMTTGQKRKKATKDEQINELKKLCSLIEADNVKLREQLKNLNIPHVSGSFSWNIYEEQLNKMNQLPQTQSSLITQLEVLRPFANKLGLYDAADYLRNDR